MSDEPRDRKADGDGNGREPRVEVVDRAEPGHTTQLVLARDVLPEDLPLIVVPRPVFPGMALPLLIEDEPTRRMLAERLRNQQRHVGIVLRRRREGVSDAEAPVRAGDLHAVGVEGEVRQAAQAAPEAPIQVLVTLRERFRIDRVLREEPYLLARVDYVVETEMTANEELKAYSLVGHQEHQGAGPAQPAAQGGAEPVHVPHRTSTSRAAWPTSPRP